jgi:hypothetical protein
MKESYNKGIVSHIGPESCLDDPQGRGRALTGATTESPSEFVDIFPTLCELVCVPIPGSVEGFSLLPILEDPKAMVHEAALEQCPRNEKQAGIQPPRQTLPLHQYEGESHEL